MVVLVLVFIDTQYSMVHVQGLTITELEKRFLEKFQDRTVTMTLVQQCYYRTCPSYFHILQSTMYLNFRFQDQFLFELLCKNTHTHKHTHTDTHNDSDEYSIVVFCKN